MSDEFKHRFNAAKRHRETVKPALRELYKHLFNGRESEWDSRYRRNVNTDDDDIYDTTADEANVDLSSDLATYFTPDAAPWLEFEVGTAVPEEIAPQVEEIVAEREEDLLSAIRASNYYSIEGAVWAEAGHGTVAMWAERPAPTLPIHCEPVAASELYICLGARGLEDRFREKIHYGRDIPGLFPNGTFSKELAEKIRKPGSELTCVWGFWRDYSDPGFPQWVYEGTVGGETVEGPWIIGPEGSCPLLVGRFNPQPNVAWGRGPGWKMLPEIRTINELRYLLLNKMDQVVDAPWLYPDDGLLDLSQGIPTGVGIPAMPGTSQEVKELTPQGNLDYGFFSEAALEERIRRGFYQDGPRQKGKTPPTLGQWLDEAARIQRRLGKPAAPLFSEFVAPFVRRMEFLEAEVGAIPGMLTLDGRAIIINPVSPLIRAQNDEEVARSFNLMLQGQQVFGPDQMGLFVDGPTTFRNIKDKTGDRLLEFASAEQVAQKIQLMQGGNETPA